MSDTEEIFTPGTQVIYGVAGLCTVEGLVTMEVAGTQVTMLKLVDGKGGVFKVSPAKLRKLGIRPVTSRETVTRLLDDLENGQKPRWDSVFASRTKRHGELIRKGNLADLALVIRELAAMVKSRSEKTLEGLDRENYDKARRRLVDEIQASLKVPSSGVEDAIDWLIYPPHAVDEFTEDLDDLDDFDFEDLDLSLDDEETMAILSEEGVSEAEGAFGPSEDILDDAVSKDALTRKKSRRRNSKGERVERSALSGRSFEDGDFEEGFGEEAVGTQGAAALIEEKNHREKTAKKVKSQSSKSQSSKFQSSKSQSSKSQSSELSEPSELLACDLSARHFFGGKAAENSAEKTPGIMWKKSLKTAEKTAVKTGSATAKTAALKASPASGDNSSISTLVKTKKNKEKADSDASKVTTKSSRSSRGGGSKNADVSVTQSVTQRKREKSAAQNAGRLADTSAKSEAVKSVKSEAVKRGKGLKSK